MEKKQILEIIQEECLKLEQKYSIPMDIQWDDIFDDEDESIDVTVELAYKCINRIENFTKHNNDLKKVCPKCSWEMILKENGYNCLCGYSEGKPSLES